MHAIVWDLVNLKITESPILIVLPRDPTAEMRDGMMSGMMTHLSICRKSFPMYATYIASRSDHGSDLVRRHT